MDARRANLFLIAGELRPLVPYIAGRERRNELSRAVSQARVIEAEEKRKDETTHLLDEETADLTVPLALGPHEKEVRYR